jgi:pimeloyl-ACP methyl ester carboxylesterase
MPHAELVVIADAHHAVPLEHPQAFNGTLKRFLDRHG